MKAWRLMVWGVPPALGGLLSRLGFRPTNKNPDHWWRVFNPAADKAAAESARAQLLAAGLKGSWQQVEQLAQPHRRKPRGNYQGGPKPQASFGYTDFARHNSSPGTWRMRKRRR